MSARTGEGPGGRDGLQALLLETSRTFALAIPRLPDPRVTEVTVAYLLFRMADTFEDATEWDAAQRVAALEEFVQLLEEPAPGGVAERAVRWCQPAPVQHDGYMRLLAAAPLVFDALQALDPRAAELVRAHTIRTCRGMIDFLRRADHDGVLRLRTLDELRAYCYAVAGIVGEMLTELFLLEAGPVTPLAPVLRERARPFGEALQLVNVLRDAAGDVHEGRSLLPPAIPRSALFALARADLQQAAEYTLALQSAGARKGIVAFTALPVLLADATLSRVERDGPGSKISRAHVARILARMEANLRLGRPVVRLPREPLPSARNG